MIFAIPTDTCYGLMWGMNTDDIDEIYRIKQRPEAKRLAICVRDISMLGAYMYLSPEMQQFLQDYPRPWSIVWVPREHIRLPSPLDTYDTLSFRVASFCAQKALHASHGEELWDWTQHFPYVLTSANPSWQREAQTFWQVQKYFPGIPGIDGGICNTPPSDIFYLDIDGTPRYYRRSDTSEPQEV